MDQYKSWAVPVVPEASRYIQGTFSGIGNLMISPCNFFKAEGNVSSSNPKVYQLKKSSWLWGPHQRKLVNESLGTFLSLQKAAEEKSSDLKMLLVKKSREYRSMIQACVGDMNVSLENLGKERHETPDDEYAEELKANCELLYKMELVLGLIEILLIDTRPGVMVLNQLLYWIRLHFPACQQKMAEALGTEQPHLSGSYWEACFGLVLQGLTDDARQLLVRHPRSGSSAFMSMDELLRKMPVYQPFSGVSEAEFMVRWQHWQSECENRLHSGELSSCSQLKTICQILCGEQSVLQNMYDILDTWYHHLVSKLLYSNPTIKQHRLHSASLDSIVAMNMDDRLNALDHLLLVVLEGDHQKIIKQSQQALDNIWFLVHVTDLLHHSRKLNKEVSHLEDLRDFMLIDYGNELVSHSSLWQVGLLYLDHTVSSQGPYMVERVLQAIPVPNEAKALKVIQAAMDRNLEHVAVGVCRVVGRRALMKGQLGTAIWWAVRSRDAAFTSHLAHQMLQEYMKSGKFDASSLLDYLGPSMLLSDTLTFLGKYREFHVLYQEGNLKEAAQLLVSLVSSRLAPQYFWPVLLEDALPLLQSDYLLLTSEQTYSLMYCLHTLMKSNSTNGKTDTLPTSFLEKEKDIHFALTVNLSRAIIAEGTAEV